MIVDVSPLANLHVVVITSSSSNPTDGHSVGCQGWKRSGPLGLWEAVGLLGLTIIYLGQESLGGFPSPCKSRSGGVSVGGGHLQDGVLPSLAPTSAQHVVPHECFRFVSVPTCKRFT